MVHKVCNQWNSRGGRLVYNWSQPGFIYDKGFPITQDHGALDYILQFANVTRPVVILEQIQRSLIDVLDFLASRLRVTIDEVFNQQGNVVDALAQRGDLNREDIEPVEQVLPEGAFSYGCTQVRVCSRDYSHVYRNCLTAPNSFEFSLLENSQQSNLGLGRQVTYFVQKYRSAISRFKASYSPLHAAGERSFLVPKQFGSDQRGRDGGTIYANKSPARTIRALMYGTGDQFLSSSGLAQYEDSRIGWRHLCHLR